MKITIAELQKLAAERGGKCLSKEYLGLTVKHIWECAEGHRWPATPAGIKYAHTWCPACAQCEKGTIEEMRQIAKERGGRCLSKIYVSSRVPLLWSCKNDHEWEAIPVSIKQGTWCLECSGTKKKTIADMQQLAAAHGGKCLSKIYKGAHRHLKWECAKQHRWEAQPRNIKQGKWCPECAALSRRA